MKDCSGKVKTIFTIITALSIILFTTASSWALTQKDVVLSLQNAVGSTPLCSMADSVGHRNQIRAYLANIIRNPKALNRTIQSRALEALGNFADENRQGPTLEVQSLYNSIAQLPIYSDADERLHISLVLSCKTANIPECVPILNKETESSSKAVSLLAAQILSLILDPQSNGARPAPACGAQPVKKHGLPLSQRDRANDWKTKVKDLQKHSNAFCLSSQNVCSEINRVHKHAGQLIGSN